MSQDTRYTNKYTQQVPKLANYQLTKLMAAHLTHMRAQIRRARKLELSLADLANSLDAWRYSTAKNKSKYYPLVPTSGICANLVSGVQHLMVADNGTSFVNLCHQLSNLKCLLTSYIASWPKYSGSMSYPVPASYGYIVKVSTDSAELPTFCIKPNLAKELANLAYANLVVTNGDFFGVVARTSSSYTRDRNLLLAYLINCAEEDIRLIQLMIAEANKNFQPAGDIN